MTSLSRNSHVIKIKKLNNRRTRVDRVYCNPKYERYDDSKDFMSYRQNSMTSLSRNSHVIKI